MPQTNFWRTLVAIGERLLRTTLHTELLEMLQGMEEEVSHIRVDAELRADAANEAHANVTKALEAAVRLGAADRQRVDELSEEHASLEARASAAEAEGERLRAQVEAGRIAHASMAAQVAEIDKELTGARAMIQRERADNEALRAEGQRMTDELAKSARLIDRMHDEGGSKMLALEERLESANAASAKLERQLKQLKEKHEAALEVAAVEKKAHSETKDLLLRATQRGDKLQQDLLAQREATAEAEGRFEGERDQLLRAQRREASERKLMAAELKANEAKAHAEQRLARWASNMMGVYRAMLPQEIAHVEELAAAALAKALREGREALRLTVQRNGVERRTMDAEVAEQEEQLETLAHDLRGTIADNLAFRRVLHTKAGRLQNALTKEKTAVKTLLLSLAEGDATYGVMLGITREQHGTIQTQKARIAVLEAELAGSIAKGEDLEATLKAERAANIEAVAKMKAEHEERLRTLTENASLRDRENKARYSVLLAELAPAEQSERDLFCSVQRMSMRFDSLLRTQMLHAERARAKAERAAEAAEDERDRLMAEMDVLQQCFGEEITQQQQELESWFGWTASRFEPKPRGRQSRVPVTRTVAWPLGGGAPCSCHTHGGMPTVWRPHPAAA